MATSVIPPAAAGPTPGAADRTQATAGAPNAAAAAGFQSASLYVGDLHPDVTEPLLFEIFNAVGPVASIRVCRDSVTRRSLGYAYVNFHQVADAERAIDTMNYTPVKGRACRIMWSQRDPALRKSGVGNVFVKNLATSVDNKALYDTFSLFGNILSCKVATAEDGTSKGYGYVHYETDEAAKEAIEKINGMLIADEQVFVGPFTRRADRPGNAEWTNCFVKNIPTSWTEGQIRDMFAEFGEITSVHLPTKTTPASEDKEATTSLAGYGFVNFAEHAQATAAVEALHGRAVEHPATEEEGEAVEKELHVCRAQKRAERERLLRTQFDQLKADRVNKYQGVNLYVKNLDDEVNDELLRAEFSPHGTITSCRVMRDEAGASKGFGFVCFSTPEEATKAITEMSSKHIGGKPIYVALAQRKDARRAQLEAQHAQRVARGPVLNQMYPPQAFAMYPGMGGPGVPGRGPMGYPMMPRGAPRGMPQGYGPRGPAGYAMPAYAMQGMMPAAGPGQGPNNQGGRGPRRNQRQQGGRGNQNQNNRNYKLTANARNLPSRGEEQDQQQAAQAQPAAAAAQPQQPPRLTAKELAGASVEQQTNMIGERLYPLVFAQRPQLAGKITGMLLEIDTTELLDLLESPPALTNKINEAVAVLEQHNQSAQATETE